MPNAAARLFVTVAGAALILAPGLAFATAQRTFVASIGNDGNPCSIVAPCRTLMTAVDKTNAGGEVIVLDSAGYGPVFIGQSVSIVAPPSVYAGISVFSGHGITVSGAGIKVALSGLKVIGLGGDIGINFTQGTRLAVSDCEISSMSQYGIYASATNSTVNVSRSVLRENGFAGFKADAVLQAVLAGVHAESNSTGVYATSGARVTVTDSVLSGSFFGAEAAGNGAASELMVTRSTLAGNSYGLVVAAITGSARLVSDGNAINEASTEAFHFGALGATEIIYTTGNNSIGFTGSLANAALTLIGTH